MAATSFDATAAVAALSSNNNAQDPAVPSSFVFDIYDDSAARLPPANDGQLVPLQQQQQQQGPPQLLDPQPQSSPRLPDGPCNYVDLSHGSSGAHCGCRRFWSRANNSIATTPMTPSFGAGAVAPANNFFNGSLAGLDTSQTGWCMCSHHACFHDHTPNGDSSLDRASITTSFFTTAAAPTGAPLSASVKSSTPQLVLPTSSTPFPGQENEQPRPPLVPLSTSQDLVEVSSRQEVKSDDQALPDISFGFPSDVPVHLDSSFVAMITDAARESRALTMVDAAAEVGDDEVATEDDEALEAPEATLESTPVRPALPAPLSGAASIAGPPADYSIPDTLSWGPYNLSARGEAPAAAAESNPTSNPHAGLLPPSQQPPPSTTTTTSYTSQIRYMRPFAGKGLQTLTQAVSLPALPGSPPGQPSEQHSSTSAFRPLGPESLTNAVQAHEARLNKLENPSFSASASSVSASFAAHQAHEECIERADQTDLRVTELESRLDEVERQVNNDNDAATVTASSVVSASTSGAPLSTTTSMNSRTSRPAAVTDPAILSQLQALQERVSLLQQQALPSISRPWLLEVVFLPFPLKGVWVEAVQFGATEAVAAAAAAQRRQTGAVPSSSGNADGDDEWTTPAQRADTPRLLPRACIPGRNIDRRLRSRGLVQTLTVRGADARSLQTAMATAFGPILRHMRANDTADARRERRVTSSATSQFLALQQPWVPLRKVHKDSRLRFLTRSEMLTPAIWDARFLIASVVMKASGGKHRLYVTQPDAYLQTRRAYNNGLSWQQLRELPQVQVDLGDNNFGIDDACWAWNSKLDEPPTTSTSDSSSSASSPLMSSSRMGRPSPSPFSRGTTPVRHTRGPTAHRASYPSMAGPAAAPVPVTAPGRSHSVSIGTSGSSEQFFTVAQSPMQHRLPQQQYRLQTAPGNGGPSAPTTLRRSLSPFFPSSLASGTRRVPPPIRTTSVPVSHQPASPVMMRGASSGAVSRRRIRSTGSNHAAAAPSVAPPMSAGVNKRSRRRSTRSPSFGEFWPRNTPRYSRSPSVTPGPGPTTMWAIPADEQQHLEQDMPQHRQQHQPAAQRVRGTTPFAYATPFSTTAGADHPPTSVSSIASGGGRRKRQRVHRHENEQRYLRNSRHGSRGPMPSVLGLGNGAQQYYDDEDMIMAAYDSDDVDDFDFPMTQDGDEINEDDDEDDDIEVYEDEQDMLGLGDSPQHGHQDDQYYLQEQGHPRQGHLLPKDQPRPGIERDRDEDEDEDDDDDEDYIGHTFGSRRQQLSGTQSSHDDEDESMSDSENLDPLSPSLFEDNSAEEQQQQQDEQEQQQPQQTAQEEEHHSDASSQPSEYPSTRRPWRLVKTNTAQPLGPDTTIKRDIDGDTDIGFHIHEDGDDTNL
ncbi:hypothetical protein SPBR_08081 [Sporothrix brasiliensis 5110]|uniref:Uncharacterized protein n=1 Tax=Sporothrix brasiliensis 5110 TaxID=1398154 RepID=A0A0C2IIZ7_9PEZI|nr:uncharacterized protein SPBR_08081 [Sporothrix brasiliensis 5110]KIH86965.1 hypothetical protein SPBR_08081 [Sporothrix brasiliensis 5110]